VKGMGENREQWRMERAGSADIGVPRRSRRTGIVRERRYQLRLEPQVLVVARLWV
jgi:hypothetical protein